MFLASSVVPFVSPIRCDKGFDDLSEQWQAVENTSSQTYKKKHDLSNLRLALTLETVQSWIVLHTLIGLPLSHTHVLSSVVQLCSVDVAAICQQLCACCQVAARSAPVSSTGSRQQQSIIVKRERCCSSFGSTADLNISQALARDGNGGNRGAE